MATDNENEKPDFFEAKHQETLKRIIELLRNKDYSKAWYKVLYDLTDGYDIPLTDEIVMTEEQADEYYAEGRICLAYVNDAFEDETLNPLCIVEAPWFGKPGNKSFLRNVVSSIAEDIDDDGYLEAWGFFHGCMHWNWTRHARYFIPAVEPLGEDIIDFYTEDNKVNLDVFCPHYGIDKDDVVSVENEKVYIRPEALGKLKREIDDYFIKDSDGDDDELPKLVDGTEDNDYRKEYDSVDSFLMENGFIGGILFEEEEAHCSFSDKFLKDKGQLNIAIMVLTGVLKTLINKSENRRQNLYTVIEDLYREIDPEWAARQEAEQAILSYIKKNSNDRS